ncbi:MAG: hypothetical protein WCO84_01325 [bacterium]
MATVIQTIQDVNGNIVLPRTRSTAVTMSDGTTLLEDKFNSMASKSTEQAKTLSSATWTGASAPFSYSLTVTGVTTTSNQEYLPSVSITQVQLEALQGANIIDGGQTTNTVTLLAWGDKPTIDIPIRVILRGDK